MKILIVSEYFPPDTRGGGELSCYLLAKALVEKGINVSVLTSHIKGSKYIVMDGIKVYRNLLTGEDPKQFKSNVKRYLFFEKALRKELVYLQEKEKFQIIHCMNTTSSSVGDFKELLNTKLVLHVNSPVLFCPKGTLMYKEKETCRYFCSKDIFEDCYSESTTIGKMTELDSHIKKIFYKKIIRRRFLNYSRYMQNFDAYMPISTYMQDLLLRYKIPKSKTKVVYNIIDYSKFLNLPKPNNKIPTVLYLGPYTKPKGALILVRALSGLRNKFMANFYGSGVLKEKLETFIKNEDLNIVIHDPVPYEDIPQIMAKHDIVVVPSLVGEALGRVCLEAATAGKTVIAFNVGGIPDIIKNGKNGFLVEGGNQSSLKNTIDHVIRNHWVPQETEVFALQKKFSEESIVNNAIEVYKKVLNWKKEL